METKRVLTDVIIAFVAVLIGLSFAPQVVSYSATAATAATAANQSIAALLYNLVPFGWALLVFAIVFAVGMDAWSHRN